MLVGFETSDDAGVYRLTDELALVTTVDFITPPVDDPVAFGAIAAANSLSDVYAMGGRPVTALNLVMFPSDDIPQEQLRGILKGGAGKVLESGAVLIGGHTVKDDEPKYGLSVNGLVHPDRIWRNYGARPGDALILTKPIGTGVLFNANRKRRLPPEEYDPLVASASMLNRWAAEAIAEHDVHAVTDITGFGLAGHAREMALPSHMRLVIDLRSVPWLPGAQAAYRRGVTTGSNEPNRAIAGEDVAFSAKLHRLDEELVFDPQTSGGLLVALPSAQAKDALARIRAAGAAFASVIGRVEEPGREGCPGVVFEGSPGPAPK